MVDIDEIIDEPYSQDAWIVFQTTIFKSREPWSLQQLLWNQVTDISKKIKSYKIHHKLFYELLKSEDEFGNEVGKANLAYLIYQISYLLEKINEFGAMHGNLRQENIIILLD